MSNLFERPKVDLPPPPPAPPASATTEDVVEEAERPRRRRGARGVGGTILGGTQSTVGTKQLLGS